MCNDTVLLDGASFFEFGEGVGGCVVVLPVNAVQMFTDGGVRVVTVGVAVGCFGGGDGFLCLSTEPVARQFHQFFASGYTVSLPESLVDLRHVIVVFVFVFWVILREDDFGTHFFHIPSRLVQLHCSDEAGKVRLYVGKWSCGWGGRGGAAFLRCVAAWRSGVFFRRCSRRHSHSTNFVNTAVERSKIVGRRSRCVFSACWR